MRPWRERGFVQDSDDEDRSTSEEPDNELSIRTTPDGAERKEERVGGHARAKGQQATGGPVTWSGSNGEKQDIEWVTDQKAGHAAAIENGRDNWISEEADHAFQHHASAQRIPSPQLGDTDATGLGIAEDALSTTSSPLSQPMSPNRLEALLREIPEFALSEAAARLHELTSGGNGHQDLEMFDYGGDEQDNPFGRRLRRRNAEQLHPYAIELQRYRQIMKSRGVKPVRVPAAANTQSATEEDTQYVETMELGSEAQDRSSQVSVPPASPISPRNQPGPLSSSVSPYPVNGDEDELPTVEAILNRQGYGSVQSGFKRRKVAKYSSKSRLHPGEIQHGQDQPEDIYELSTSLPTPVGRARLMGLGRVSGFRVPPGMSPAQAVTPATSVLSRDQPSSERSPFSDDDLPPTSIRRRQTQTEPRRTTVVLSDDSTSESSDASSSGSPNELRNAQKKIRGVLPASWLKLDQQAQKQRHTRDRFDPLDIARDPTGPQRGVAKRLSKPGGPNNAHAAADRPAGLLTVLSDLDDSSDSEAGPLLAPPFVREPAIPEASDVGNDAHGIFPDVDEMEDNRIDRMASGDQRRRPVGKRAKPRQMKLTDVQFHSSKPSGPYTSRSEQYRKDGEDQHRRKRSKAQTKTHSRPPRPRLPRLSIVDAPSISGADMAALPQFIRLAIRQARKRPDQGRHSPTKKYIRLLTVDDTTEANSVLRDWRENKIPQQRRAVGTQGRESRAPLSEWSKNQQTRFPDPISISPLPKVVQRHETPSSHRTAQSTPGPARQRTLGLESKQPQPSKGRSTAHDPTDNKSKRPVVRKAYTPLAPVYRPGALEGLESDFNSHHRGMAFQKALRHQDRNFIRLFSDMPRSNIQLQRFLSDEDAVATRPNDTRTKETSKNASDPLQAEKDIAVTRRLPRKRRAQRIDAETALYRQPVGYTNIVDVEEPLAATETKAEVLTDLGSFGVRYSSSFDVRPLELGTYFQRTTFVGSGQFLEALDFKVHDLDSNTSKSFSFELDGVAHRWGCWNEDVASELTVVLQSLTRQFEGASSLETGTEGQQKAADAYVKASAALRQVMSYLSQGLSFLDPPDRLQFLRHVLDLSHPLFRSLPLPRVQSVDDAKMVAGMNRVLSLFLVLVSQMIKISLHATVDASINSETTALARLITERLMHSLVSHGTGELRRFLDDNRRHLKREAGVGDDATTVESIVVMWHVMAQQTWPLPSFWQIYNAQMLEKVDGLKSVPAFESIWRGIFMILPSLEFSPVGDVRVGARLETSKEDWALIRSVLSRLLLLYPASATIRTSTLNDYIRTALTRCFRLVQDWGWRKCEPMLNTVFDFFAKNGLSPLRNEGCHGSPRYLESLETDHLLDVHAEDKSFHIFLKMLTISLKNMQSEHTAQKIRNIAYRFIPNHGRTYRKDEAVRQEDIDALRNHHDLLCVLYSASPSGHRPKLALLRDLVDHSHSHREACRLNIRSWSRLAKFQLSRAEELSEVGALAEWCREIIDQTVAVYRLARAEAEEQYEKSKSQGLHQISHGLLESTINTNESKVLATLCELLAGMTSTFAVARESLAAGMLLQASRVLDVFKLFDTKKPRTYDVVTEALRMVEVFRKASLPVSSAPNVAEESQDYGDFPDIDDFFEADSETIATTDRRGAQPTERDTTLVDASNLVHESLHQLLSSCFGAEPAPADAILAKMVDTWVVWANHQVSNRERSWSNFLDQYSNLSWHQLRDTAQTRKYKPYYLALILETSSTSFYGHEMTFVTAWLLSLVERESMLKYQHRFTNALLRVDPLNPLFENLPFIVADPSKINISLKDIRERRLMLLSSVLSNMRGSFETSKQARADANELKREYAAVLKQLMGAMRKNYLELQHGGTVQGAYVTFVQRVVEFLQQYTTDICPVDRFFTDSEAFPLPSTDPTYVVGRLRSYGLKLHETSSLKQLAVFIQTVSERAAADGQQKYLVSQLCAAVLGSVEVSKLGGPSLRRVLLQAILPAYIQQSLKTAAGWLLARPILQASMHMLAELPYVLNGADSRSTGLVLGILTSVLQSLREATGLLVDHSGLLEQPHVLQFVSHALAAVTALLPCLAYLDRRTVQADSAMSDARYFKRFAVFVGQVLLDGTGHIDPQMYEQRPGIQGGTSTLSSMERLAARELQRTLDENWSWQGGVLVIQRGGMRREVVSDVNSLDSERAGVKSAILELLETWRELQLDGTGGRQTFMSIHQGMAELLV